MHLCLLPFAATLFLGLSGDSRATSQEGELVDPKIRKSLRTIGEPLAKLGDGELVALFEALLFDAGDGPEDIKRFKKRWDKTLAKAQGGEPRARDRAAAAKKIHQALAPLAKRLGGEAEEPDLAEWVLRFDSMNEAAQLELGRTLMDGAWLGERELGIATETARFQDLFQKARDLDIEVTWSTDGTEPTALAAFGEGYGTASANGMVVYGGPEAHHLEQAVAEVLQALAYSSALLGGELVAPTFDPPIALLFTGTEAELSLALDDLEKGGNSYDGLIDRMRKRTLRGLGVPMGFYLSGWVPDPQLKSILSWLAITRIHGRATQPTFMAGHLNGLCLRFYGTGMPSITWHEPGAGGDGGSTAKPTARESAMWRAASSGMYGARSWLVHRLKKGQSPTFARTIQDEMGKIEPEPLLVATVVADYLAATGELQGLMAATSGETDRTNAIEEALGRKVPALDAEWHGWLLGASDKPGILQRAAPGADASPGIDPAVLAGFEHFKKRRAEALGGLGVWIEDIELFGDLSEGARLHAEYLHRNPDQETTWPGAHEEYPDRAGFTSEGAWAGQHSVIHFKPSFEEAIDGWLGTLYHRLPLLDPGLFGTGLGLAHGVNVVDTNSLRNRYDGSVRVLWPADGAQGVPVAFVPELPNPIPGEDQRTFGYPITLQDYTPSDKTQRTYAMELREEGDEAPVDCYFLSPSKYYFEKHVPDNAYALIPKAHLSPKTTYVVTATCEGSGEVLEWTFRTGK